MKKGLYTPHYGFYIDSEVMKRYDHVRPGELFLFLGNDRFVRLSDLALFIDNRPRMMQRWRPIKR